VELETMSGLKIFTVHLLLCSGKIFRHGNKNTLSIVMVYSALFITVPKTFIFFLNKYAAEIQQIRQWHLAALHTTEVLHRVLTWLGIDYHHKM
jgi:hypothetical protein